MNSLCQMLDIACVSKVLLTNGSICMTKGDSFRVLRREWSKRKQETEWDSGTHWDNCTLPDRLENKICWMSLDFWVWLFHICLIFSKFLQKGNFCSFWGKCEREGHLDVVEILFSMNPGKFISAGLEMTGVLYTALILHLFLVNNEQEPWIFFVYFCFRLLTLGFHNTCDFFLKIHLLLKRQTFQYWLFSEIDFLLCVGGMWEWTNWSSERRGFTWWETFSDNKPPFISCWCHSTGLSLQMDKRFIKFNWCSSVFICDVWLLLWLISVSDSLGQVRLIHLTSHLAFQLVNDSLAYSSAESFCRGQFSSLATLDQAEDREGVFELHEQYGVQTPIWVGDPSKAAKSVSHAKQCEWT